MRSFLFLCFLLPLLTTCTPPESGSAPVSMTIDRRDYEDRLYGFWLGQCIANWTGLVTEMDKIGDIGPIKTGPFYTRADWGGPDQPSIWAEGVMSDLSPTIDFVLRRDDEVWGSDDDTDIEYLYQHLLATYRTTTILSARQIRDGWLRHILPEEENYLWVSNQRAYDMMLGDTLPPLTGDPAHNEHYAMIDAQLTTEIFGLFAPGRPDVALRLADLPIRTTARHEAADIARFYVHLHAQAILPYPGQPIAGRLLDMADEARTILPEAEYPAAMYDYVRGLHTRGEPWEAARDSVYQRYQVRGEDGYDITSRNLYCNGCFAAGINFAASLVSLFYGEGDLKETIKIGTLAGWDSDNPTATWGGLLGFMHGRKGVEAAFGTNLSNRYNIHRTRRNFPRGGLDTFERMAREGADIAERMIIFEMKGGTEILSGTWTIYRE